MKLTRREFIKVCQALGLTLPLQVALGEVDDSLQRTSSKNTKVIIIGAGAAGLSAGYLLKQQGIDFRILEASSSYGGRMKQTTEFADFPIPLGAEWIHVNPSILKSLVNDDSIIVDVKTTRYDPNADFGLLNGRKITLQEADFTEDSKFVGSTWFGFFEKFILPSIKNDITYNAAVKEIDYSNPKISVKTIENTFLADRVICSLPVKMLQQGMVSFNPPLPRRKQKAIKNVRVWDGCKAFIAFEEKFYPTFVGFDVSPSSSGQKLYYNASYGQDTHQNVLGLFAVGKSAEPYIELSGTQLINYILQELDELFDGKASSTYLKHTFQNWTKEPFIKSAYVVDHEDWRILRRLGESINGRIFFAGDAYTNGEDWGAVHTAIFSAKKTVDNILSK